MILTVGSIKGGCGKSLIATNLTVISSQKKRHVLLVDADEQGTTSDWADHRIGLGVATPWTTIRLRANAVRTEILKLTTNYDDIIIDCGGRDTASLRAALTISDIFLIPFQPKSFDIWTASKVSTLVEEAKSLNENLLSYAFINCGCTRGNDNDDAEDILSKTTGLTFLPCTIAQRKAFSNATADGLSVIELKNDPKAVNEIFDLYETVFKKYMTP